MLNTLCETALNGESPPAVTKRSSVNTGDTVCKLSVTGTIRGWLLCILMLTDVGGTSCPVIWMPTMTRQSLWLDLLSPDPVFPTLRWLRSLPQGKGRHLITNLFGNADIHCVYKAAR